MITNFKLILPKRRRDFQIILTPSSVYIPLFDDFHLLNSLLDLDLLQLLAYIENANNAWDFCITTFFHLDLIEWNLFQSRKG